jgi:hypothetical protein
LFLRKLDHNMFFDPNQQFNFSWAEISKEFNKNIEQLIFFKSDKHCKERWFNHLSPFLKKYKISLKLCINFSIKYDLERSGPLKMTLTFYQNAFRIQRNGP